MRKNTLYTMGLAAVMTAGLAMTAFAGWSQNGGDWYYHHDRSSDMITDEWVKSGDYFYYLGHDGKMVTNSLIDDVYYVDANGARVTNSWQYFYGENIWDEDEAGWRYF
ncbi:MAG: cell wall-binding protein, partial [Lachnospiraceae bacterium]|nr:cell wall-binding protein [Lachnospiraceae bacterium]